MLCVYASELGALTGTIPGKVGSAAAVVERIWKKHCPQSHYAALMRSCGRGVDGEAKRKELMERFGNALAENEKIVKLIEQKDMAKVESVLRKRVEETAQRAGLSKEDTEKLERSVLQKVAGEFGHKNEELVRKKHAEIKGVNIKDGNDTFRYKKLPLKTEAFGEKGVKIGGRFDGIVEESGRLVEYKTRKNGMKRDVPLYELAQLHAYMFIVDCREIDLVQCEFDHEKEKQKEEEVAKAEEEETNKKGTKGKKKAAATKKKPEKKDKQVLDERTVEWDEVIWRALVEALENFFKCYARLLNDEQLQLAFVCCEDEYERETLFFEGGDLQGDLR